VQARRCQSHLRLPAAISPTYRLQNCRGAHLNERLPYFCTSRVQKSTASIGFKQSFDPGSEYLERRRLCRLFFVGCCLVGDGLCPNADVISLICVQAHRSLSHLRLPAAISPTYRLQNCRGAHLMGGCADISVVYCSTSRGLRYAGSARNKSSLNKKLLAPESARRKSKTAVATDKPKS